MDWEGQVIMTSSDVADFLKIHIGSVRQWSRTGKLKGYRLGDRGDWRYLSGDVLAFLQGDNGSLTEVVDAGIENASTCVADSSGENKDTRYTYHKIG